MKLGTMIHGARVSLGLSLSKLATASGVSPSYLSRVEMEQRQPGPRTIAKLAKALELDLDDLFGAAGVVPPDMARWIARRPTVLRRIRAEMAAS